MLILLHLLLTLGVGRCTGDGVLETKTVGVGEREKLTCPRKWSGHFFWIRLVSGSLPQVLGRSFKEESVESHIKTSEEFSTFVLSITEAKLSDSGIYYCLHTGQKLIFLKGVDLRVEGPKPDPTTVPPSDPGDSVTLQCSDYGEHSVSCVKSGSHQPHLTFSCTPGNGVEGLSEEESISSDAATVATCQEIFCGNQSELNTEASECSPCWPVNALLGAALAICLIVIAVLTYSTYTYSNAAIALETNAPTVTSNQQSQQMNEESLIYSVPTFTKRKAGKSERRTRKAAEGETVYSDIMHHF